MQHRAGTWWHQDPDGSWLRWDDRAQRWVAEAPPGASAPPPPPPPAPSPPSSSPAGGTGSSRAAPPAPPPVPVERGVLPDGRLLASWGQRVGAALLDLLLVMTPVWVVAGMIAAATADDRLVVESGRLVEETVPTGAGWIAIVVAILVAPLYFTLTHGSRSGQTLGKRVVNIRVADEHHGGSIGHGRALGRWLVAGGLWWTLVVPGILDVLWPLWDEKRQTWHDKAVRSVVEEVPRLWVTPADAPTAA